jgi:hypothetical protein
MQKLSDILKPKSQEELKIEINNMPIFQIVYSFSDDGRWKDVKKLLTLKKKIICHFLSFSYKYWILVSFYMVCYIAQIVFGIMFPRTNLFPNPNFIEIIWYVVFFNFIIYLIIGFILRRKFNKWMSKKINSNVEELYRIVIRHQEELDEHYLNI